jgi:hypothetical protein
MVKKFVFIALSVILFAGCNSNELEFDNIQLPTARGTFSIPLGELTYTIRDLIDQQNDSLLTLQVDDDSLITLVYFDSIGYESDTDFVEINDNFNSGSINLNNITPVTADATSGPITIDLLPETFTFNFDPEDNADVLDSLFYADGEVSVIVTSDVTGTLDYTFTLPNFVTVTNETPIAVTSGNPVRQLDVPPHKSLLSGTNNQFTVDFTGSITLEVGQTYDGDEFITFDLTIANQVFSIVYGKFGQDTVSVGNNETLNVELFSEFGKEGLFFGNPILRFNFENSFGIPIGIDFSTLYGTDGTDTTFLSGDIVRNIPIIASGDINNPFGPPVATTIEIKRGNSSIVDLLAASPSVLGFNVPAISNPEDPTQINFIAMTNQITSSIEIEIPLEVKLENMQQTSYLDLGDGLDVSDLDSAVMRVFTLNEMPFSTTMTMDIQDADSNSLYLIPESIVMAAPFINVDGFVTDPNGNTVDIPLSQEGINALGVGSHIAMTVTGNTPGSLNSRDIFVKILTDYTLEISVGIQGVINYEL